MLLFDIGANRGDAVVAALEKGFDKIIALEPAPRIFAELVRRFIYAPPVIPLKFAVADSDSKLIEFYEAMEDGLSTMNIDWLTSDKMPYNGKDFRTIEAVTCTIDWLVEQYGVPDLIKIDVEGAEWAVFHGMTRKYGKLAFEWTEVTLSEHEEQLDYLQSLGYTEFAPQYIVDHLKEPEVWLPLEKKNSGRLTNWNKNTREFWELEGWKEANLRPTADVGMIWIK